MTTAPLDLQARARARRIVLKDEPAALVELLGSGADAVVRKVYRNRGLRLLQTFWRRARAEREHRNLALAAARGLPCTPPLSCAAHRRLGFVLDSTLVTGFVPDTRTLKQALAAATPAARRQLVAAMGALLRAVHDAGVLWCTAMPRNVLVRESGDGHAATLLLCDLPAAIDFGGAVPRSAALLDLYDAFASASRRREASRSERLRGLCSYARGDRRAARELWRALHRRRPWAQRALKNLVMALRTYILPPASPAPTAANRTR